MNVDIDIYTKDEVGNAASASNKMVRNTNNVMTDIKVSAEQVSSGSGQVFKKIINIL